MGVQLNLNLLGGFGAFLNHEPISHFKTAKTRALLVYLALNSDKPLARQSLSTLLWPNMPTQTSLRNLRLTLHRLRETFDKQLTNVSQQLFTITRHSVQLNGVNVTTDVEEFETLIAGFEQHPHPQSHQCDACLNRLVQAAELYQGELLAGFSADDAVAFEEWLLVQQERLNEKMLFVLQTLATLYMARGEQIPALDYARRLLALDSFYEEGYRLTMQILAASGRRSEAMALFENGRELFLTQLGVEPMAETVLLFEQIRDEQFPVRALTLPPRPMLHHFPALTTSFYGRNAELNQVQALLLEANYRLVTVMGTGGVGKTRLVVEAAKQIVEESPFIDGIYFFPLETVTTLKSLLVALFAGLGLEINEKTEPREQLLTFLSDKRCLLVIDNFEQLVDEAPFLVDIVAAAPHVQLLVTSRFALNIRAEHRLLLGGLALPPADEKFDKIAEYSSVRLFLASAQRVAPQFELTEENYTAVIHVCQLIHGLPLALEISGAWVRLMDVERVAAEIRKGFGFLETPMRDMPLRHRSITAVFTYSWQLLSSGEQVALAQLSVFRGGFGMQTAVSVTGASYATLGNLLDYSLLQRTENGRIEIHGLIHQFAKNKLAELENSKQVSHQLKNRHSDYYLAYVAALWSELHGRHPEKPLFDLKRRQQNIRAAWAWAVKQERWQPLLECVDTIGYFYALSGQIHEGVRLFSESIEQHQSIASTIVTPFLGKLLLWQSNFLFRQGFIGDALSAVSKAHDLVAKEPALEDLSMRAKTITAQIQNLQGDYQKAQDNLREAMIYYEARGEKQKLADVYGNLGHLFWRLSQYDDAKTYLERGLALQYELENIAGQARQINILGLVYRQQGELSEAESCFRQSLRINQALGHQDAVAKNLTNLSIVFRQQGKFEQALSASVNAENSFKELGHREGIALLIGNRGIIQQSLGDLVDAEASFIRATALDEALGNQAGVARHLGNLGYTFQVQNRFEQAMNCYDRAIPILRKLGAAYFLSTPLLHKAEILLQQADWRQAYPLALEGLQLAQQVNRAENIALGHIMMARVEAAKGQPEVARERLRAQLAKTDNEVLQASFHDELWQMGAGISHAAEAAVLYRNVFNRMPDSKFKARLDALKIAETAALRNDQETSSVFE